ncbi:MAG: barnase inhibitor [Desulfuromonadales bacterium]|nr:MAG: barnase inhibitor [Desulfuromonadales bacterium]
MPVTRCILDGATIQTMDDIYRALASQLPLPSYFGRNLDALWDILSTDIEGPVELVWEDAAASRIALGKNFDRIEELLKELERERDDFRVIFR